MATRKKGDDSTTCKCPKSCGVCSEDGHCPDHCTRKPPKSFWALFDGSGVFCGVYESSDEAAADAFGPRFRKGFEVIEYKRVKK